jgi:4-diphosphocytidyl-2-C-methyl-D-erythritol kinase
MIIKAYAKINLTLEVLGRLPSGYHEIRSVMQTVDIVDTLTLKKLTTRGLQLRCNDMSIFVTRDNTVNRAIDLLEEDVGKKSGLDVVIEKNIPLGSGLSGGSSNGAAMLKGLNELWKLNYNKEKLMDLAKHVGSDVPFHIVEGTALCLGVGDIIQPISPLPDVYIVIAYPNLRISTRDAYRNITIKQKDENLSKLMVKEIQNQNLGNISKLLFNDFEGLILKEYPKIREIKYRMLYKKPLGALLTGTGSAVYCLTRTREHAQDIADSLTGLAETYITKNYNP